MPGSRPLIQRQKKQPPANGVSRRQGGPLVSEVGPVTHTHTHCSHARAFRSDVSTHGDSTAAVCVVQVEVLRRVNYSYERTPGKFSLLCAYLLLQCGVYCRRENCTLYTSSHPPPYPRLTISCYRCFFSLKAGVGQNMALCAYLVNCQEFCFSNFYPSALFYFIVKDPPQPQIGPIVTWLLLCPEV